VTIVALVPDLMDQSRIRAALATSEGSVDVTFARDPARAAGAAVVVVDLARFADRIAEIRAATTGRIVAFGPHVDDDALAAARSDGADVVVPRSQFFRDPASLVTGA